MIQCLAQGHLHMQSGGSGSYVAYFFLSAIPSIKIALPSSYYLLMSLNTQDISINDRHLRGSHLMVPGDTRFIKKNKYHLYIISGANTDPRTHKPGPLLHAFHQRTCAHVCDDARRHESVLLLLCPWGRDEKRCLLDAEPVI